MKTIKVLLTKTYYKSVSTNVEVPRHLTDDEISFYLENDKEKFTNILDGASLNPDMDGIDIEVI